MKRRLFLKNVGTGLVIGTGSLTLSSLGISRENEAGGKEGIDSNKLMDAAEKCFTQEKRTCSGSLLKAGSEALGVKSSIIPDIAMGFGGGIGMQRKTCGAVTGAAMVLSIAAGLKQKDHKKKKMLAMKAAGNLFKRFEKEFGTTECKLLTSLGKEEKEKSKNIRETIKKKCTNYVKTAARLLAEELNNMKK